MNEQDQKMKETIERQAEALVKLRAKFEPNQISLLPKPYKKDAQPGKCNECGGWHGLPAAHLEYVGHAALTDRLLDVDPLWSWEPLAMDARGLPLLDEEGGLWIKLTVCGMTRLGYGDAQGKKGPNATKERIGDALRNAAMRFGAALDLWHKGILHMDGDPVEQSLSEAADKWIMRAGAAADVKALEEVWTEGAKDLIERGDRPAYDEFKAAVKARKAELQPKPEAQ